MTSLAACAEPLTDFQPVDRLLLHGPQCLTDAELVELLLRHRGEATDAVPALDLLTESKGVTGLLNMDLTTLRYHGLSDAEAVAVLVAGELSRRQARQELSGEILGDPEAVARYLFLRFGNADQEIMGALFVDNRNVLIAESEIFRGSMNRARVEPRAVLRQVLVYHATGLMLFHTHPGGEPIASREDVDFTTRMLRACELMEVRLLDHLIVAVEGSWVSLKWWDCC